MGEIYTADQGPLIKRPYLGHNQRQTTHNQHKTSVRRTRNY